ncbi:error-prone DNA polymerase [Glaciecola sp. XM2]|uniref:error-prone DNA polymerase n=1 Tax=Glaciecola sp. XM2 TaxID=1914931 RepID=UPI001BDEBCF9|nr:error-prone DNA polymerase [Glaciecola sp. XM2]MBT1451918.1 error-prone DNA polymerase [Glaciecola sp. XM2]
MATLSSSKRAQYAELICQSNFSFLYGASHPEEYVRHAYFLGYQALAITDECSMAGVVRAYTEIKLNHIPMKLIVGSLFKLNEQTMVLLCPDKNAYSECCRIITNARRRAKKGHYELSEWDLKSVKHCLCLWLPSGNSVADITWGAWLQKHFKERLFLAVKRWLTANEEAYIEHCQNMAEQYHLDIVATSMACMHEPSRLALQHSLHAIREGKTLNTLGRTALSNAESCLRPITKLAQLYPQQWLENAVSIAKGCQFCLSELAYAYPAEVVAQGMTPSEYLRYLVEKGIKERFKEGLSDEIRATIEKELILIKEQSYEHFFLTIYDIVQFAKKRGILYQGRGSAANSVVCYCLEITAVDPRQISVLFERFISKERNEPPDIDVDFEHERREEVIQYIYRKYGRERTALAATVVCYRFKSALREIGKVMGINSTDIDFFISNVNRRDRTLSWQSQLGELGIDPQSDFAHTFISLVEQLMGFPRHLSQHVGGFVISAGPLYELVPIENASMADRTVIQWDKDDLESLKLLKVDVLALGMLTAIRKCFDLLKTHYQQTCSIPFITKLGDDRQVYQQIQQADTVGIFQIESRAQMSMLPRLKPACYYDLVVQIAIVRPGPIQGDMVHPYLRRRDGLEAVSYPSPEIKQVLSRTMGVPIFQEQVIQLAMVAAGFTGGEADQLRRAMASWKKNGALHKFRSKLIDGMTQRNYSVEYAERLFEQICGFGEYGFPESHSASFAVLAYVSAWIKHYYPAVFYVGLLNSLPMGFYTASQLLQDAKHHQIKVLPCCVLNSHYDHVLTYQQSAYVIRLGLRIVKGLKQASVEQLVIYRNQHTIRSIACLRALGLPQSCIQALASANALSALSTNRFDARWQIMDETQSLPLFASQPSSTCEVEQPYIRQPSLFDNLIEDYESTGLSIAQHPIKMLSDANLLPKFSTASQLANIAHKTVVNVIGVVACKQSPGTAAGVTFITLEDHTGNTNVVVWQRSARAQRQAYLNAKILHVNGILERGNGDVIHVIAGRLTNKSDLLEKLAVSCRSFH